MKKQELEDLKEDKAIRMPSIIDDISILLHYYGVHCQKEDHDLGRYQL